MSKIDDLINKLCPNGVKFFELGEIATFSQGIQVAVNEQKYEKQDGFVRFLRIIDYTDNNEPPRYIKKPDDKYIKKENELIMIRYGTPGKVCIDYEGAIANNMFKINFNTDEINTKYMYYYLSQNSIYSKLSTSVKSTMPSINFGIVSKIRVAVPPIEVQCEIVHILDEFTLLSAELSAELKARQQQYEYYKEKLLGEQCDKTINLGSLCKVITKGTTPSSFSKEGITFIKTEAFENGNINKNKLSYISEEIHNGKLKRSILEKNDILFTIAGATIGKMAIVTEDLLPANTNQALAIIRLNDGVNLKYIKFILTSSYMKKYIQKCVKGSAQPNLNLQQLNEFEFPFPDMEKQEKIIDILDKFDLYANSIIEGLPAEIEARQKQYEYYRDKLLTFKELEVNEEQ